MTTPARSSRSLSAIFAAPIALGLLSLIGLIAALLGNGPWDIMAWLGLGLPLAVLLWALTARRY